MSLKLDYWRAVNMWAAKGRPDGNLGMETVTLQPGQNRLFITDLKYEKVRNDDTNYYGSHGRRLTNSGTETIYVILNSGWQMISPGETREIQDDIKEVTYRNPGA